MVDSPKDKPLTLRRRDDVEIDRVDIPFGQPTPLGRQLLPTLGGHDGFYYSRLIKAHTARP